MPGSTAGGTPAATLNRYRIGDRRSDSWATAPKRVGAYRIYAQFHCPFDDPKTMSFHEPARDEKRVGNFRNAQPFKHCAKYDLINRLQSV